MSAARLDFLTPRRTPRAGIVLLVLGVFALGASLWLDQRWSAERAASDEARRAQEESVRQAREQASRPVPPTPDELRRRAAQPLLRQPWLQVLRVLESATEPPVYLLGLSVDPATGNIRVEGEAPSFAEALDYAQTLRNDDVIRPAQLRSHEIVTDPNTGRQAVRFMVTSQWISR